MEGIKIKPRYIAGGFILAAALIKLDSILEFAGKLTALIFPIVFGFILAALLDTPVKKAEAAFKRCFPKASFRLCRCAGVTAVYFSIAAVIVTAAAVLIPGLSENIKLFVNSFDGYYANLMHYANNAGRMGELLTSGIEHLAEYARSEFPKIAEKAYNVTSSVIYTAGGLLIAAVISMYMLLDKEKFLAAVCRVMSHYLGEERMCRWVRYAGLITGCFSRFICGQLTEALVLGIMCFLGMIIFGFEYPLLISVIIGITALIPVVGAFIGTIPSALTLFLIEPAKALWFVVFILVLQQIEGNLIYPKVVGKSVGLPPVLVLTAIVIGAGIGGAAGILLGIPVVSAVCIVINEKTGREHC